MLLYRQQHKFFTAISTKNISTLLWSVISKIIIHYCYSTIRYRYSTILLFAIPVFHYSLPLFHYSTIRYRYSTIPLFAIAIPLFTIAIPLPAMGILLVYYGVSTMACDICCLIWTLTLVSISQYSTLQLDSTLDLDFDQFATLSVFHFQAW